jgi:transcriptional regulator GlxA family with amidase domain
MRSLTETEQGNPVFLEKSELQSRLVPNILRMMDENLSGSLRVEDIARQTNYSRAYIFREFKRATGKSIIAYYNEKRIRRAEHLLCTTELSVREIAEKLGFDTPNYFSKTFRRITGQTPLVSKKQNAAHRAKKMAKKIENGY